MSPAGLIDSDRDLIRRLLTACVDGPFFEECEYHTLFGMTRPAFREATRRWTESGTIDPEVELAVQNALGNLLGYPQGMDRKLEMDLGASRQQLDELLSRWRTR